jgi:hypothetical protein
MSLQTVQLDVLSSVCVPVLATTAQSLTFLEVCLIGLEPLQRIVRGAPGVPASARDTPMARPADECRRRVFIVLAVAILRFSGNAFDSGHWRALRGVPLLCGYMPGIASRGRVCLLRAANHSDAGR